MIRHDYVACAEPCNMCRRQDQHMMEHASESTLERDEHKVHSLMWKEMSMCDSRFIITVNC